MSRPQTITDEQITAAAREVFVEQGPGASVARVAERLGVSHAALFNRAGSKVNLMLDALCPGEPDAAGALQQEPPSEGARERLCEILTDLMHFLHHVVPNLVVLKSAGLSMDEALGPRGEPPPVVLRRSLAKWLERAMAKGALGEMPAAVVAEGLLGAMEARCFNAYLGGPDFAPGGDRRFLEELVNGLVAAPRAKRRPRKQRRKQGNR